MDFLLVDDDAVICKGIARRLRDMNGLVPIGAVHCRHSAEDALAFLKQQPVDILITDIRMYEMDGLTLISKIRGMSRDMGFIVVTAYHNLEYTRQAIRLGVDDYLLKPYSMQALRETVVRVTQRLAAQRAQGEERLRTALLLGMHEPGVKARDILARHGIACPEGILCLLHCGADIALTLPGTMVLWHRRLNARLLLACPPKEEECAFREWADRLAQSSGGSLGVSLLNEPPEAMMDLACQAQEALALAWCFTQPCAIFYKLAKEMREEVSQTLLRCVKTLNMAGAREALQRFLTQDQAQDAWAAAALYGRLYQAMEALCAEHDVE